MIIEGVIEDIIFRNEDNGYTVALLSHNEEMDTIVGKFVQIKVGENVRLTGSFTKNAKYGDQFAFDTSDIIQPNTLLGIEKYLSSGLIPGVGPVTAKNIVDAFGKDSLDMIEFSSEKLSSVKGISRKKAEQIHENFSNIKKLQRAVMFLQKYEITTNMALKIYESYNEKTIEIVQGNPYKLVEDVQGIGFLTADKIAMTMGTKKDSEFRIRAGVLHVLSENSEKSGNTFMHKITLTKDVFSLLNIDEDENMQKFESVLQNLIFDKAITVFVMENAPIVMLSKLFFTEKGVAKKLAKICMFANEEEKNLNSEIAEFERENKITFHESQKEAITLAATNGVSVITGGPGTGKTTIVKCIITILKQAGKNVLLLAPTGRAAKRLSESTGEDAKTIHRALELNFASKNMDFAFNESNPLQADCVIVDEVSMVDIILANSLLKALKLGSKLILVGDKDQLPSVSAGNVLDDILKSNMIKTAFLTKIFRQEDKSLIISNAHLINNGEMPVLDNSSSDFFYENKEEPFDIKESILSLATERIPSYFKIEPDKIQILAPLKAGLSGVENLNRELQEKLNPPSLKKAELVFEKITFRCNDKVMQTANNYNQEWKKQNGIGIESGTGVFNGDMGVIDSIDFQTGETVVIFDDGRQAVYSKATINQLALAYAITIHKSQGCEFDVVIIPVLAGASIMMTRNLLYTAVTRAKKMVVLVGDKKNIRRMVSNSFRIERKTCLKEFLIEEFGKMQVLYGN